MKKPPVKPLDLVIILLALGATGASAFGAYAKPRNTTQVYIEGGGRRWVFPLDAEETVTVSGPLGDTVVRIHGGEAWVDASPCENQICVGAGHIHQRGYWVACLPNNVFLMIEGTDDEKQNNGPDTTAW